jgi:ABC-type polysaccharide/polyol phosphate export permease
LESSQAAAPALVDRALERDSLRQTLSGLLRYRELLRHLVAKDLKLKYRGSILGFVWSLLNPLVMISVYTIAFRYILQMKTPGFVLYLVVGILAWNFFATATLMATGAIIENGGLLKSVAFPRAILPIASVLFNFAQYVLTALVYFPIMLLVYRVPPSASMLAYPVFLLLHLLFTIGLALLLATGTAFFRDLRHFLEIALAALFWLTPVLYEIQNAPPMLRGVLRLSPVAPFIGAYHDVFFYRRWPDGLTWTLAIAYAGAAVWIGMRVMLGHEDRLSEQI